MRDRSHQTTSLSWLVLLGIGIFDLLRGGFHALAPDSGAGSVAGFDLSGNGEAIIFLLALVGVAQLAFGIVEICLALRQKHLVTFMLMIGLLKSALALFIEYVYKAPAKPVPGRFAHWAQLVIITIVLIASRVASSRHEA